jgi:predicted aspartyl protease/cytochrome c-type biogenesis protein CcmH/NrfG
MRPGLRAVLVAAALVAVVPLLVRADATSASHTVDIQLQLGDLFFSAGRYADALDAYRRADARAEGALQIRAKTGLVRSALRVAEFDLAREHAAMLRRLAPGSAAVLALYGDSLWSAGQFDEAEETYRDVLALDPQQPRAHHGLARALAGRNQMERALSEAATAVRLAPDDPEVHFMLGMLQERKRELGDAISAFSNYINLLPNKDLSAMAVWARSEIQFLRSYGDRVPLKMEWRTPGERQTLPFRLDREKVMVKARLNGKEEVEFAVDTGAENTVLSVKTAQRFGIYPMVRTTSAGVGEMGLRGLQVGRIDTLEIGDLKIENVRCVIKNPPLIGLPISEGESLSPLALGLSATIDYQRRELTMGRSLPQEPAAFELPLRMNRLATVRGTVNDNRPTNFVVDTGGEVVSISAATARTLLQPPRPVRIRLKVYGTSGWDPEAYLLPGVHLSFDEIRFQNIPVVVLDLRAPSALLGYQIGGIIGHHFLSKYRVGLDLERSVLRLNPL